MEMLELVSAVLASAFTLSIFSFVFEENKVYDLVEHLFVGAAGGYLLVQQWKNIVNVGWLNIQAGKTFYIISIILGIIIYFRLWRGYGWVARYPIAFLVAISLGLAMRTTVEANILAQIRATILPLSVGGDPLASFNNIVMVVGVITSMSYFIYSREHTGPLKVSTEIGKWFMMIGFGALLGNTVMSRVAYLIGVTSDRIIAYPGPYVVPVMVIILIVAMYPEKIFGRRS